MKYIFVVTFVVIFALFGLELGYTIHSPLYTHLTYMFQHVGIIHIIGNSIAFIGVFHTLQKFLRPWVIVLSMIDCGFVASFLSARDIPTVGASSMVYAMIGIYIGLTLLCRHIKIADTRKYLLFLFCVAVGLVVSLFNPNSNFGVHAYSLVLGFAASLPIVWARR